MKKIFYTSLKTLYLLFASTTLPVAMFYIFRAGAAQPENIHLAKIFDMVVLVGFFFILVIWELFAIALAMYYYPARLRDASIFTLTIAANMLMSGAATKQGYLFASYTFLLASLITLILLVWYISYDLFKGETTSAIPFYLPMNGWGVTIVGLYSCFYLVYFYIISVPWFRTMLSLGTTTRIVLVASLLMQVGTLVRLWYQQITHAETHDQNELVSKEWDRWAVIVVLVISLSVTASLLTAIWGGLGREQ